MDPGREIQRPFRIACKPAFYSHSTGCLPSRVICTPNTLKLRILPTRDGQRVTWFRSRNPTLKFSPVKAIVSGTYVVVTLSQTAHTECIGAYFQNALAELRLVKPLGPRNGPGEGKMPSVVPSTHQVHRSIRRCSTKWTINCAL